jgi:restriction system protein
MAMSYRQMWQIEVRHEGLKKYRLVRGTNKYVAEQQAAAQRATWDEMWRKRLAAESHAISRQQAAYTRQSRKDLAAERTTAAREALGELEGILAYSLTSQEGFQWEMLKDTSQFNIPRPELVSPRKPLAEKMLWNIPVETDVKYQPKIGIWDRLVSSKKMAKLESAANEFRKDLERWTSQNEDIKRRNQENELRYEGEVRRSEEEHQSRLKAWEEQKQSFLENQQANNGVIVDRKKEYFAGAHDAIVEYCDLVLSNSTYPDYFPRECELDYNPETKMLVVDYYVPSPEDLPRLKEVKFVQSRGEFVEVQVSESEKARLYDSVLYQVALRVTRELYDADIIEAIYSVVFNGWVRFIDKATGNDESACILSLQADRAEFALINLSNIDPKACFRSLSGVSSSKLHNLVAVAPIIMIDREDRRFVPSHDVADGLGETTNLAAMDWEDFEHLIRELFEKEFASSGGEVKVTQASRDGGVDAIAFDADPIRGGKIVIQAKRYTNVVGVSAVRDLYGTVMNEGATKGILVTTATFGPDAYQFAKGKPLTLLSGGNLLSLLEKHGHRARIDLKEAKKIIAERT